MKHSASSRDSPPDGPTLFIDRNAWSNSLHAALERAGIPHEAHRSHFGEHDKWPEYEDSTWLSAIANRGWTVVTRDKNIRYRVNELLAMRAARLHVFVFTQTLTADETGRLLVACYPSIARLTRVVKAPAFFSIARSGAVSTLRIGR